MAAPKIDPPPFVRKEWHINKGQTLSKPGVVRKNRTIYVSLKRCISMNMYHPTVYEKWFKPIFDSIDAGKSTWVDNISNFRDAYRFYFANKTSCYTPGDEAAIMMWLKFMDGDRAMAIEIANRIDGKVTETTETKTKKSGSKPIYLQIAKAAKKASVNDQNDISSGETAETDN